MAKPIGKPSEKETSMALGVWPVGIAGVVVMLAFCGGLGGLAVMGVQRAREAANAAACKNNLRQLALGAANHQHQRGDHVPMGTFSKGLSWSELILPYIEQYGLWRPARFDLPYDAPQNAPDRRTSTASVGCFYCPSRRRPAKATSGYLHSDYAVPSLGVVATLDNPNLNDTWMQCHDLDKNHGPCLLLFASPPTKGDDSFMRRCPSQTSYASFLGGTTHQILFGEKALHPSSLGRDGKAGDFTVCSFIENNYNASGAARPANGGISASPYDHQDDVYRYWGSWHPGMCPFAFADGSYRPLNISMSATVLTQLCDRTDKGKSALSLD